MPYLYTPHEKFSNEWTNNSGFPPWRRRQPTGRGRAPVDRRHRVDLGEALFQHDAPSQGIPLLTVLLPHHLDLYLFHISLIRVATLALFITLFGTTCVTIVGLWTQPEQLGAVARGQGRGVALVVWEGEDSVAFLFCWKYALIKQKLCL